MNFYGSLYQFTKKEGKNWWIKSYRHCQVYVLTMDLSITFYALMWRGFNTSTLMIPPHYFSMEKAGLFAQLFLLIAQEIVT